MNFTRCVMIEIRHYNHRAKRGPRSVMGYLFHIPRLKLDAVGYLPTSTNFRLSSKNWAFTIIIENHQHFFSEKGKFWFRRNSLIYNVLRNIQLRKMSAWILEVWRQSSRKCNVVRVFFLNTNVIARSILGLNLLHL